MEPVDLVVLAAQDKALAYGEVAVVVTFDEISVEFTPTRTRLSRCSFERGLSESDRR